MAQGLAPDSEAVTVAERALSEDPFREEGFRLLAAVEQRIGSPESRDIV